MKSTAQICNALNAAINDIYESWHTNTGALTDTGAAQIGFLRDCQNKIKQCGESISAKEYFGICEDDSYDHTTDAWYAVDDTIYTVALKECDKRYKDAFHHWYDIDHGCEVGQYFVTKEAAEKFADQLNELAWTLWKKTNSDANSMTLKDAEDLAPRFIVKIE